MEAIVLDDRGLIFLSGDDTVPFLQSLVTNDIEHLEEERALYAGLLTPQGKFLHDFLIVQWGQGILLDTDATGCNSLLRRLTMYRLRARVDIREVTDTISVCALVGDANAKAGGDIGVLVPDPRHRALGYRLYLEGDPHTSLARQFPFASRERYEEIRLHCGVPDSHDIPTEKAFPLEYGFDALGAVSYNKGCFVGQELTARTHNRGKVKKGLHLVEFAESAAPPGTPIKSNGTIIGETLSGHGKIALAHLRLDAVAANRPLAAGDAEIVRVQAAPTGTS